ncbi:FAD synthetase family protein [Bacillus aquiflavi]|uniref:FAD synthase n=1 Tax=Bacillus aquiflavi TaxID=2672567 RepID=A0A6B3W489_9BACI|nr:FAD synthetase family protein [Bacillus aquiflavi]MBA4538028.1 FAD synthetase family protein [Bacillus aquiflavi]NEY82284.1 FAD synthetase family protein [Bacillus aquiflavi]
MKTIFLHRENVQMIAKEAVPTVLAIGFFDGVHVGHQQVIKTAKQIAKKKKVKLGVMTFSPHPTEVLSRGKKAVQYLTPLSVKETIFTSLGVDILYVVTFDEVFSALAPKQFVAQYLIDLHVIHVVAGFDFTYGTKGKGNMGTLFYDSDEKLSVTTVTKVIYDGNKISSTYIRQLLNEGAVDQLPAYLGRHYVTKGNWHKAKVIISHHYTYPKQGYYYVELSSQRRTIETVVSVIDSNNVAVIDERLHHFNEGEQISIHWKEQVSSNERKLSNF